MEKETLEIIAAAVNLAAAYSMPPLGPGCSFWRRGGSDPREGSSRRPGTRAATRSGPRAW